MLQIRETFDKRNLFLISLRVSLKRDALYNIKRVVIETETTGVCDVTLRL